MAGETPQLQAALNQSEKRGQPDDAWPRDENGVPMVKIQAAASELVPTVQYGNVTIGPVMVTRFVADGDADHIKAWVRHTQEIAEIAVSEDRKTVHDLTRARSIS